MKELIEIIKRLKRNSDAGGKLVIVLGDGYDPTSDIIPPVQICKKSKINSVCDIKKSSDYLAIWRVYEKVRFRTSNQYPDPLLFYITQLSTLRIVSTVVTTNYDSYWRSIRQRKAHSIAINPVPDQSDKYYDNPSAGALPVYIVHGQFDYARHRNCGHRNQLPSFIDKPFKDHHNYVVCNTCRKKVNRHHDIDWMNINNRDYYATEIDYAKKELSHPKNTAGILALGFKGFYSGVRPLRDEELVRELVTIEKKGIPVFAVTSAEQSAKIHARGDINHLSGLLKNKTNVMTLMKNQTITAWFQSILTEAGLPIWEWMNIYTRLWQSHLFEDRRDKAFT